MQEEDNITKRFLGRVNHRFRMKEKEKEFVIDPENHKIDKKHGVVKNFMRLTNKTFIGFSRIKVNRTAMFAGLCGLLTGYLCSEIDDNLTLLIENYRPVVRDLLIKEVLRNPEIKAKLNQTLLENVYTNPQIQYKLSQVLVDEAVNPQLNDLFLLSKRGVIEALQSEDLKKLGVKAAVGALNQKGSVIAELALQFLGGPVMLRILRERVSELLSEEEVNEQLSLQLKQVLRKDLNSEDTQEKLYSAIRQKFVNW